MSHAARQDQDAPIVRHHPARGRFELLVDDRLAGVMTYRNETLDDGTPLIVIDHSRIKPDFAGQGLGSTLARGVVEQLRAGGAALRAECPFLCGWLERHPDLAAGIELRPVDDEAFAWQD